MSPSVRRVRAAAIPRRARHRRDRSSRSVARWSAGLVAGLLALALVCLTAGGTGFAGDPTPAESVGGVPPGTAPSPARTAQVGEAARTEGSVVPEAPMGRDGPAWRAALEGLLARRAEAYATGQPRRLAAVYAQGSPALRRDRASLRAWTGRGLTVERAVVRVRTARQVARTHRRVVLRVVDRLAPAVAVGPDGARRALPRDHLSAHAVTMVRTGIGWRLDRVRALSG